MFNTIAGRTLSEWRTISRRDDCLANMVPSDLRALVNALYQTSIECDRLSRTIHPDTTGQ